jgi:predicted ATP-grasp superfamily ATP-dependent carboligase
MGYYGFAEPELIKDPRDGEYKLLEINARTTLQNRLAAACGADMEYLAFLDANGTSQRDSMYFRENVLWVDDLADLISFLIHFKRRDLSISEVFKTLKPGKVHSVVAWDDPVPFVARVADRSLRLLRLIFGK